MNKDNAKDYLPFVQALADGKTIQCGSKEHGWTDIEDHEECTFPHHPSAYRIKPEPREIWVVDGEENLAYFDKDRAYATGGVVVCYREVTE